MSITAEQATTLLYLSSLWEGIYRISIVTNPDALWLAECIETGEILRARYALDLQAEIRDHRSRLRGR